MHGTFFIPVFFFALAASLTAWFTVPRWNGPTGASDFMRKSIAELKADEAVYRDAFSKMREIELTRTGLAARYNTVSEKDRVRLGKLLPDTIDSVRLILDIENVARMHGLKLRSVSASVESSSAGGSRQTAEQIYQPTTFSFNAIGPYENFVPFLSDLEASVRLSDVTGANFESKDSAEYVYGITLRTYILSENKE